MSDVHGKNKNIVEKLHNALYNFDLNGLKKTIHTVFDPKAEIYLAYPFENVGGPNDLFEYVYKPLSAAIPDLERREFIRIAGPADDEHWVGCAGHYVGVFERPWLDIPPTYHAVAMRFHEFYHIVDEKIVEMQALWDIPQVMMQARAWPMSPSLGVEWLAPAPAPQNGLPIGARDIEESEKSLQLVLDMLGGLQKHAEGGPEAMNLAAYWHPRMTWYGPAGIGTNRRISGFRNWHQIPFLKALPDRGMNEEVKQHFFAEGPFVGETAWPGMRCTVSGDGWLGIVPGNQKITMKSLDFWRREGNLLRENWVLVDLLDVYHQLGVDVFSRMRELTVERQARKPQL